MCVQLQCCWTTPNHHFTVTPKYIINHMRYRRSFNWMLIGTFYTCLTHVSFRLTLSDSAVFNDRKRRAVCLWQLTFLSYLYVYTVTFFPHFGTVGTAISLYMTVVAKLKHRGNAIWYRISSIMRSICRRTLTLIFTDVEHTVRSDFFRHFWPGVVFHVYLLEFFKFFYYIILVSFLQLQ